ncbi:CCR4-NOT core ubiquitin-protein ligase subunit MOT2 [Spizellomyces punctatus DAOM BR117]|uniref:RING-type domain-containing protein n=1 Tax=Spizellomyces punctatus (strain DAOM BR117) TaxID=645134 RepID=A0A0L0H8C7_SPIPD|nr:CCR4-NOT core ubiquitin-protein ligase subunit MOT2 [Spizellomyces punctatus DAOM BR117]KNC96943.1 hypothetical protein SPPG_07766 [Spizellomyces punctatus DAOM BR117]|eukprot:XP_016604983.1 hypothetical protein SPPG_07766 [Spizellomyces punctatus DAOM BR117]
MSVSSDEEDLDCPLCMEEIDITDRYFKPCPCGYQICRFCWNHIKENLNGLCPACRRPYSEDTVEFRPVPPEEIARIKAAKKKKERERKEQDQMSRRHLANVRIVQKNLVYVLGLPPKIASEDILRSQDYFGQYGKITRVVVNRRAHSHTPVLAQVPNTGVYITFTRKEEAARAIEAVDGSVYDGKIIRATYGTTKYCASFLKNQPCQNPGCQFLHEPGEEADSFAKEELSRMQLRERNPKPPPFPITLGGKKEEKEESALPPTASWAKPVARPQGAHHYSAASISSMSSSASGPPRSPEMDMDDVYDSNLGPLRQKSSSQLGQVASIQLGADRKAKGKNKLAVSDLPPGFASTMANQQELSLPGTPEVEQVMGSRALDESGDQQAVKGSSPGVVKRASEENASKPTSQDELDDAVSPSAMGFILHPKYIGPFDPFREDPLAVFATISVPLQEEGSGFGSNGVSSLAIPTPNAEGGRFDAFHETQAPPRSNSRASDSGQRSRFERFFGNGQISDADGSFDASDAGEKPKEESKTVQESFRAMFPNVNVSFASGSLSEAEARWGESFSPSKLAVPDASAEAWSHGQGFPLRSQTQQMAFQGGLRGVAGQQQYGSSNSLAMRQQEQLLHQQQYLSSLSHNQQVQPHLLSQLQQLRLAQMQQQQQHFAGVPHSLHPHQQPQDELIGQLLRDAQLRETHIRQDQIRELQMRAAAGAGQSRGEVSFRDPAIMSVKLNNPTAGGAAPGFEGRTRPRTFEGVAPSQGQSLDYQQEWPSPPGTSALGPGYVTNGEYYPSRLRRDYRNG